MIFIDNYFKKIQLHLALISKYICNVPQISLKLKKIDQGTKVYKSTNCS
jgi:hypothetical protein